MTQTVPDTASIIVFVAGVIIFSVSMLQLREHLRFRRESKLWIWNLDPEARDKIIEERVRLLRGSPVNGEVAGVSDEVMALGETPATREELARHYEEMAKLLRTSQ